MKTTRVFLLAALLALALLPGCSKSVPAMAPAAPATEQTQPPVADDLAAQPTPEPCRLDRSAIPAEAAVDVTNKATDARLTYDALLDEAEAQGQDGDIDLTGYALTLDQIEDLTARCAPRAVAWELEVDGVAVPWNAKELDLSGHDLAALELDTGRLLDDLKELERVDMCGCGYSNDEMAQLQDTHPGVRIIWEIKLSHWTIRTDVVAFSTMKTCSQSFFLHNDEAKYLKYCTDLVALDLGHNYVTDISFLQYMPNLKILILVDNVRQWHDGWCQRIDDLSMLKYTPKLEYLEFFVGSVKDLSFLQYTPNIVDLNISYNPVSDATYLFQLPKLERLLMEHTHIPYADFLRLRETYPNAQIEYYGTGSIDHGWRTHPRYYAMRDMFKNNYVHPYFADDPEPIPEWKAPPPTLTAPAPAAKPSPEPEEPALEPAEPVESAEPIAPVESAAPAVSETPVEPAPPEPPAPAGDSGGEAEG